MTGASTSCLSRLSKAAILIRNLTSDQPKFKLSAESPKSLYLRGENCKKKNQEKVFKIIKYFVKGHLKSKGDNLRDVETRCRPSKGR